MNRRNFMSTFLVIGSSWAIGFTPIELRAISETQVEHEDPDGYYTCSMHPQIHQHEPGKCPICGMPLIKVKGTAKQVTTKPEEIEISTLQQKNIQISKFKVEKKDFVIHLPVSGRALSSQEIAFQVYESDVSLIKSGYEFTGTSSMAPEKSLKGHIVQVDRLVDPSSRTIRVVGRISGVNMGLIVESGFHGEIINTIKNQIVVPEEAVLRAGRRDLVYVFTSDSKLEARKVQLGAKSMREYQILSGLKEGDVISSGPNFLLDSEAKLRGF